MIEKPRKTQGWRASAFRSVVEPLTFDRLYGAWSDRVIASNAKTKVLRSADRYLDAISRWRGQTES